MFTGARADYGLLSGVLGELAARRDTEPLLLVTGSHLSPVFSSTATEIEADGVPITAAPSPGLVIAAGPAVLAGALTSRPGPALL